LEFRTKHRAELLALRYYIEDVYERILNAGDGELAWNKEIDRLQGAIADHIRASREFRLRLRLADFEASLNLFGLGAALATAHLAHLPALDALLPAGIASVSVNIGIALKRRAAIATPFQYVISYNKELF
jgi:hypothetical protein